MVGFGIEHGNEARTQEINGQYGEHSERHNLQPKWRRCERHAHSTQGSDAETRDEEVARRHLHYQAHEGNHCPYHPNVLQEVFYHNHKVLIRFNKNAVLTFSKLPSFFLTAKRYDLFFVLKPTICLISTKQ
jgi:hypothetical protein